MDIGHEEGGSAYANAGMSLRSPPAYSRASPPKKNQSLHTVLLCALIALQRRRCGFDPWLQKSDPTCLEATKPMTTKGLA